MKYPVYHERQRQLWCGLHSLNNALQYIAFTPNDVHVVSRNLADLELSWAGIDRREFGWDLSNMYGNLDVTVIQTLLESKGISTFFIRTFGQALRLLKTHPTQRKAIICETGNHFVALTHYRSQWYYHDSMAQGPVLISLFALFTQLLPTLCRGNKHRFGRRVLYFNILE